MKTDGNWTVWCKSKTNPTDVVPQEFREFGKEEEEEYEFIHKQCRSVSTTRCRAALPRALKNGMRKPTERAVAHCAPSQNATAGAAPRTCACISVAGHAATLGPCRFLEGRTTRTHTHTHKHTNTHTHTHTHTHTL